MNTRHTRLLYFTAVLLLAVLISSCELPNVHLGKIKINEIRIGMVGSNQPGSIQYSFKTFNGFESQSFRLEAGQTAVIHYETILSRGSLKFELQDQERYPVWQVTLDKDSSDAVEIPVEQSGSYTIAVQADNASGSFDISWQVE